jgi:hypothetical protein
VRKRHIVVLTEEERARLHTMIGRGVAPASDLTHARILLKANQGEPGLDRRRHRGRAGGQPRHRGPGPPALGRGRAGRRGLPQAARALLPPPPGRAAGGPSGRADLQRPAAGPQALDVAAAGRPAVALGVVESVSYETVRQALQQPGASRG